MSTRATDADSLDTRPGTASVAVAVAAGLVTVLVSATTPLAGAVGPCGLVVVSFGVRRGSRLPHRIGSAGLFGAVLLAGVAGTDPVPMLVAAGAAVVAWDAGEHGIGLGRQLGHAAVSTRAQLAHVGVTVAVGSVVAVVGYVVYDAASTGQPTTAIALSLGAALLFTYALDR
ncbi:hypothetical protein IL252_04355 [Halomicrobium sp. IBSBa]|uniref:DUF7519 family protein n=1 Tax=Halomicrobium sp. IBSBa TaxID=2778916 RepID=UPI001ABF692B|nr:hypothetical protein [Halomicrobium sp. IBSBa]MBO4247054.1 hypothetical protein [Halomicrobium sp. IBSBa]